MDRRISPNADCSVALRVGKRLWVDLPENPTTGFQWVVEGGSNLAANTEAGFYRDGQAAPGSSGLRSFSVMPTAAGREEIVFALRREWDSVAPRRRIRIVLVASGEGEQGGDG